MSLRTKNMKSNLFLSEVALGNRLLLWYHIYTFELALLGIGVFGLHYLQAEVRKAPV